MLNHPKQYRIIAPTARKRFYTVIVTGWDARGQYKIRAEDVTAIDAMARAEAQVIQRGRDTLDWMVRNLEHPPSEVS